MSEPQTTNSVLLVRPAGFEGNPQTAGTNRFQKLHEFPGVEAVSLAAIVEFDALVLALQHASVATHVFEDTPEPHTPDAVFPNNWVSFHREGTVVLYPMLAPNRRLERRFGLVEDLAARNGFAIRSVLDLTHWEREGRFLEGTGSLVLDRVNHVAYACRSPRTDPRVLDEFARSLGYETVTFDATDDTGVSIYHTNVVMSIGTRFAAVCREAIAAAERGMVLDRLRATGREVLVLSRYQMQSFAGNILELRGADSTPILVMSATARDSLIPAQVEMLEGLGLGIVAVPVPTIERFGGGSVRCMIAEIHLEKAG